MKKLLFIACIFLVCHGFSQTKENNKDFAILLDSYYEELLKFTPLNATTIGDTRYNDLLPAAFTDSYNASFKNFYTQYDNSLRKFQRDNLNDNDKISYDIISRDIKIALKGLNLKINQIPFNQFYALPLTIGQLGSGTGSQPFKTMKDYQDWLSRASKFSAWCDSAIVYFKKGIKENNVLPKALVIKMIPQLEALQTADITKSVFYGPLNKFPAAFTDDEKIRLIDSFKSLISNKINPAYAKLAVFLKNEYLPKARLTSGLTSVPRGDEKYNYYIQFYTTTNKKPDELFNIGLSEVKRIRNEMEKVKREVNYSGSLNSFFDYTKTDSKFLPYKTAEEVLEAYRAIQNKIDPNLNKLFGRRPKTPFEIRQTEAFRAASAAAQYYSGLADGSRPGVFYVPIIDATKYTTAKENLFIHEAIPGHHYQGSLQRENLSLPRFRQYGGNSAYSEGWALYCESLGKDLGCYTDPYQYFYALGDEIHRAIRLVVDAGMHAKGWTREKAIEYMRSNEPITEQSATAEIERYMAIPGQALSYKVGALKILELRNKYTRQLGTKFNISAFHDELLKDGNMPLEVLERKMNVWANNQKGN